METKYVVCLSCRGYFLNLQEEMALYSKPMQEKRALELVDVTRKLSSVDSVFLYKVKADGSLKKVPASRLEKMIDKEEERKQRLLANADN